MTTTSSGHLDDIKVGKTCFVFLLLPFLFYTVVRGYHRCPMSGICSVRGAQNRATLPNIHCVTMLNPANEHKSGPDWKNILFLVHSWKSAVWFPTRMRRQWEEKSWWAGMVENTERTRQLNTKMNLKTTRERERHFNFRKTQTPLDGMTSAVILSSAATFTAV